MEDFAQRPQELLLWKGSLVSSKVLGPGPGGVRLRPAGGGRWLPVSSGAVGRQVGRILRGDGGRRGGALRQQVNDQPSICYQWRHRPYRRHTRRAFPGCARPRGSRSGPGSARVRVSRWGCSTPRAPRRPRTRSARTPPLWPASPTSGWRWPPAAPSSPQCRWPVCRGPQARTSGSSCGVPAWWQPEEQEEVCVCVCARVGAWGQAESAECTGPSVIHSWTHSWIRSVKSALSSWTGSARTGNYGHASRIKARWFKASLKRKFEFCSWFFAVTKN